jgi:hypothetical protein
MKRRAHSVSISQSVAPRQTSDAIRAVKMEYKEEKHRELDKETVHDTRAMKLLFPMLEAVYKKAEIVSCASDANKESSVRLEGFNDLVQGPVAEQAQSKQFHAVPVSPISDPMDALRNKLFAQYEIVDRVQIEFDNFRETYPAELRKYSAVNQHRAGVNEQLLKDEF